MKNIKHYLNICVFLLTIGVLSMTFIIGEDKAISVAERRPLKSFEQVVSAENPFKEIESYFLDQFPFRDTFRTIKAFLNNDVLKKNDNNNIYTIDGTVVKIEDTLDENQLNYAVDMINKLINKYAKNNNVYYSIIPDKHYFASQINGYPALDYEKLLNIVSENLKKAEYIDIFPLLELSDYYKTDSHWSQDKILDIADKLVSTMSPGVTVIPDGEFYKENVPEEIDFIKSMQKYNVKKCYYGHLHTDYQKDGIEGIYKGIEFKLVSSDYLNFDLVKIN